MKDELIQFDDREFRLSRLIDGDLSADEMRELEGELARDAGLRRALDEYRRTDSLVRSAAGPIPELDWGVFSQRIQRRCQTAGNAGRRWTLIRLGAPLAAAAAIALVLLLPFDFGGGAQPSAKTVAEVPVNETQDAPTQAVTDEVVISVVFNRSQPDAELESDMPDEEGSYVIAAAGAGPLDGSPGEEETAPTF